MRNPNGKRTISRPVNFTLDKDTERKLEQLASFEFAGNRSAALRNCIRETWRAKRSQMVAEARQTRELNEAEAAVLINTAENEEQLKGV